MPEDPQPAVVSHDREVLVYATSESAKTNKAKALCVDYEPIPFPSRTADVSQKASNRRKHKNGGESKQVPIDVDDENPSAVHPPARDTGRFGRTVPQTHRTAILPATASRPNPLQRGPTAGTFYASAAENNLPQEFQDDPDTYYQYADMNGKLSPSVPYHHLTLLGFSFSFWRP